MSHKNELCAYLPLICVIAGDAGAAAATVAGAAAVAVAAAVAPALVTLFGVSESN